MSEPDEQQITRVESPIGLLPDLSLWGIEEVDTGVCEDTYENRKLIRANKAHWLPLYDSQGQVTQNIQVVTPEMRQAQLLANRSSLLTDDRDPDSDYLSGLSLILEPGSEELVPAWVLAASRQWQLVDKERKRREREAPEMKMFRPALAGPPGRCAAIKLDGHRCQNWHGGRKDENSFCRMHIGNQPNREDNRLAQATTRARNRLQSAAIAAAEEMENLMTSATSEVVKLNAAKEILDRAGVRGGTEIDQKVEVVVTDASKIVRDRMERLARGHQEAIERQKAAEEAAAEAEREAQARDTESMELVAEVIEDSDE